MQEQPLTPAAEQLLQSHDGPISFSGREGQYVAMRRDVYEEMLGSAATIADVEAGRTHDVDDVFDSLEP